MSSTGIDHKSCCPVLEGMQNFPIWKIRIIAYLQREMVVGYTLGTAPHPTITMIVPLIYAPATSKASWDKADAKAHGVLIDHILDCVALKVSTFLTLKQVLDKIICCQT
jgi:glucose-6-phosphate dehydrogenase assembly protein OpcA